ncbi:MAG: hypothetical protein GXP38_17590 [Chloroflexi bacterium]|nr:hypothetical protein [Chloroflexota bacterium]
MLQKKYHRTLKQRKRAYLMPVIIRRAILTLVALVLVFLVAGTLSTQIAVAAVQDPTSTPTVEPTMTPTATLISEGEQSQADTASDTTPGLTGKEDEKIRRYDLSAIILATSALVLLAFLFFLLFRYSHRLEQTGYLGQVYQAAVEDMDYAMRAAQIDERWLRGDYEQQVRDDSGWMDKNPEPDRPRMDSWPDDVWSGWADDQVAKVARDDASTKSKYMKWEDQVKQEARERRRAALDGARKDAKERAKKATSIDWGTMTGRGGSRFVLEFTAIVVIIFTALILGILGVMNTEQIGTLLAAIAGYVLGRATARTQTAEGVTETSTPQTLQGLAELTRAMSGRSVEQVETVSPITPNAGLNQTITLPATANLKGKVTPDIAMDAISWSKFEGPGDVSFDAPNTLSTSATFSVEGVYTLRLTVTVGGRSAFDSVEIRVLPPDDGEDAG